MELDGHAPTAEERVFHVQFIELPQQPKVFLAFRPRLIVIGGTGEGQQAALLPDAQIGMLGIDPSALVLSWVLIPRAYMDRILRSKPAALLLPPLDGHESGRGRLRFGEKYLKFCTRSVENSEEIWEITQQPVTKIGLGFNLHLN